MKEVIELILKVAMENTAFDNSQIDGDDDFNIYDSSGGNFDDAYEMGVEDGRIQFARELLAKIKSCDVN